MKRNDNNDTFQETAFVNCHVLEWEERWELGRECAVQHRPGGTAWCPALQGTADGTERPWAALRELGRLNSTAAGWCEKTHG